MASLLSKVDAELRTTRFKTWAKTHRLDEQKIMLERAGKRRPATNDSYAAVVIAAIRVALLEVPVPPPVIVGIIRPFNSNGVFLIEPTGGTEDILAAKAAGFGWVALNTKWTRGGDWSTHRSRCAAHGVAAIPWCRVLTPDDARDLEDVADQWGAPAVIHNLETEAMTTLTPAQLASVAAEFPARARAVLTEPWMQPGAGWSALKTWVAIPEAFLNAADRYLPLDLTNHAHDEGMPMAIPACGWGSWSDAPIDVPPSTYLEKWPTGPFSVYFGDGREPRYQEWRR